MPIAMADQDQNAGLLPLGRGARGLRGEIVAVGRAQDQGATQSEFDEELERRLLEIGFVEGAHVEILHEGFLGKDPIAVRVDDMSVALRRREADAIFVRVLSGGAREKARV